MSSIAPQVAPSTSSSTNRANYEVFISFRGVDTRYGFTDSLYQALKNIGIIVFRDDEELERGEEIYPALKDAIINCQIVVVVVSPRFAESKACLSELAVIMERRKMGELTVLPVFYHVNPSDVGKDETDFGKCFAKLEGSSKEEKENFKKWKSLLVELGNCRVDPELDEDLQESIALKKLSDLSGWHVKEDRSIVESLKDDVDLTTTLQRRLRHTKVLIVLDNVSHSKQVEELAERSWFGEGSRIIITSRNQHLPPHMQEHYTYEVKKLKGEVSSQLFCLRAFNNSHPKEKFKRWINEILNSMDGLPLALEVAGSHLNGKEDRVWDSYVEQVKKNLDNDVLKNLKISYDGMGEFAQEVFLDIACFFSGSIEQEIISKLKSLEYHAENILNDLECKSLIKFIDGRLYMHDLLAKMGQEIAGHSRLWRTKNIIFVLRKKTGFSEVKGIFLQLPLPTKEELCFEAFSAMENLKMILIRGIDQGMVEWYGEPSMFKLSDKLCIMEWWNYPLKSLPARSNFEPDNLVELKLKHSQIEQLWDNDERRRFLQLRHMDLSFSQELITTPNFSQVRSLEILDLSYCKCLTKVDSSIGSLKFLRKLLLQGCCNLKQLPNSICELSNLYELVLDDHILLRIMPKLPLCLRVLRLRNCPVLEAFDSPMTKEISEELLQTGVPSMVTYIGFDDKPYKILYVHSQSPSMFAYVDAHHNLIKFAVACGPMLGSKIPQWFIETSTSSNEEIKIHMDWNFHDGISGPRACALFIIYEVHSHEHEDSNEEYEGNNCSRPKLMCKFQIDEASPKQTLVFCVPTVARHGSHGVWVFINTHDSLGGSVFMQRWNYQASITTSNKNVVLKECGARLLGLDADSEFSKFLSSNSQLDLDSRSFYHFFSHFVILTSTDK